MKVELKSLRVFDVLRNSLNGELHIVMAVTNDLLDLRDKTGAVVRYKFGPNFTLVSGDEASDFRAQVHAERKRQQGTKKRKPLTAETFLKRLAKSKKR